MSMMHVQKKKLLNITGCQTEPCNGLLWQALWNSQTGAIYYVTGSYLWHSHCPCHDFPNTPILPKQLQELPLLPCRMENTLSIWHSFSEILDVLLVLLSFSLIGHLLLIYLSTHQYRYITIKTMSNDFHENKYINNIHVHGHNIINKARGSTM